MQNSNESLRMQIDMTEKKAQSLNRQLASEKKKVISIMMIAIFLFVIVLLQLI